jgi:hypothetical protein
MEQQVINHEILLFTGSGFCSRQFCKRDSDVEGNNDYSAMEELEKACWDGMLYEMLPELAENAGSQKDSYIWSTTSGVNFLCINMGGCSMSAAKQTSINPYFFLWAPGRTN